MVRSLYSGVAGMVAHQTKMDVVGNNISNVSTYGYKSSRATFKDVYYQTNSAAMSATPSSGGTNPKQVGYGAKVGSVDVNHAQSVMSTTGYTLDVAIAGEGYLQVMDADGNIFYTKAGMLDIDAEGNLVDINGYFVLGVSGSPSGVDPSSNRIKVNLPYLSPAAASISDVIDGTEFKIEAENQNENGNVNIQFVTSNNMPYGQKISANITSASIIVTVNGNETFEDLATFTKAMNEAITAANGGVKHSAGDFTITMSGDKEDKFVNLKGSEIVDPDFSVNEGKVAVSDALKQYLSIKSVGDKFAGDSSIVIDDTATPVKTAGPGTFSFDFDKEVDSNGVITYGTEFTYTCTIVDPDDNTQTTEATYTGFVPNVPAEEKYDDGSGKGKLGKAGSVLMVSNKNAPGDSSDSFVVGYGNLSSLYEALYTKDSGGTVTLDGGDGSIIYKKAGNSKDWALADAAPTEESKNLGIGSGNFLLKGGTEGGEQTVADLTGISINNRGVIVAEHPIYGSLELGRIDLATFANPAGLNQVGDTYFAVSRNSGPAIVTSPGTNGTGDILGGTLETSNTDLAHEMADMITTQRGFQACSRMITVSDSMLEELINLKR